MQRITSTGCISNTHNGNVANANVDVQGNSSQTPAPVLREGSSHFMRLPEEIHQLIFREIFPPITKLVSHPTLGTSNVDVQFNEISCYMTNMRLVCRDGRKLALQGIWGSDQFETYLHSQAWLLSKAHRRCKPASANQALWNLKIQSRLIQLPIQFDCMSRELTHNYLDSAFEAFEWPQLEISGLWMSSMRRKGRYESSDWKKVEKFLLQHAKVATRPSIVMELNDHVVHTQDISSLAQALQVYGKGSLKINVKLDSQQSAERFNATLRADVVTNCHAIVENHDPEFMRSLYSAFLASSSIERLHLDAPACEQLPYMLKAARRNQNLNYLIVQCSHGRLDHLTGLPEILQGFQGLETLTLLLPASWDKAEVEELSTAIRQANPALKICGYHCR